MVRTDPYTPSETQRFECRNCLARFATEDRATTCPECGRQVRNLSVARE